MACTSGVARINFNFNTNNDLTIGYSYPDDGTSNTASNTNFVYSTLAYDILLDVNNNAYFNNLFNFSASLPLPASLPDSIQLNSSIDFNNHQFFNFNLASHYFSYSNLLMDYNAERELFLQFTDNAISLSAAQTVLGAATLYEVQVTGISSTLSNDAIDSSDLSFAIYFSYNVALRRAEFHS